MTGVQTCALPIYKDLRTACLGALQISRAACRTFALRYSWENSARQFIGHVRKVVINGAEAAQSAEPAAAAARG